MNRGVMVTRGKPDEEELVLSAGYGFMCSYSQEFIIQVRERVSNWNTSRKITLSQVTH